MNLCVTSSGKGSCSQAAKAARLLLFIKMLLVIPFGVLVSTLVLYLRHQLQVTEPFAISLTTSFLGSIGVLRIVAGFVCDRYLSHRLVFLVSAILLVCGSLLLVSCDTIYWGIACIAVGFAFSVSINYFLGSLFKFNDLKKEKAFFQNYSGMNIGYLIAFAMSSYYELSHDYSQLFMMAGLISFIALILIILNWNVFYSEKTSMKRQRRASGSYYGLVIIITTLLITFQIIQTAAFNQSAFLTFGVLFIIALIAMMLKRAKKDRTKTVVYCFALITTAIIFATIQQLMPTMLTLFVEKNVDKHYLGFLISPQWMQLTNTLAIILGSPALCYVLNRLRNKGINLSGLVQFSAGLVLAGLSLLILVLGLLQSETLVSFNWIIGFSVILGFAELLIVPVGLAMISKISADNQGIMMGGWLLLLNISALFSSAVSQNSVSLSSSFLVLGGLSIFIGLFLYLFVNFAAQGLPNRVKVRY